MNPDTENTPGTFFTSSATDLSSCSFSGIGTEKGSLTIGVRYTS